MKTSVQHITNEEPGGKQELRITVTPDTEIEQAVLGAAFMLDYESVQMEDDGSLSINFVAS